MGSGEWLATPAMREVQPRSERRRRGGVCGGASVIEAIQSPHQEEEADAEQSAGVTSLDFPFLFQHFRP